MKIKILLILLFTGIAAFSQSKGTLSGTVTDKEMNNETLPFANVVIKGTTTGTNTDENGKYTLKLDPGTYTVEFSFIGYETTEEKVTIVADETVTIDKALGSGGYTLEDVVLQSAANREKESALLMDQKKAVEIKQVIGAEELSRKGVNDAEGAVTKMTGITKQEGEKNVFVRGLGDRYNSTTMNGLPLPSDDPAYKNISLEFFSSDIIKGISVNKTFGSEIYSDVGGANIDILSKEMTGNQGVEISVASGVNSQTFNKENFKIIDGGNWFGSVPYKDSGITDLNVYNFRNSLNPNQQSSQLNSSISASAGRKFNFGDDALSVYVVGNFSNGYNFREGNIKQTTTDGTVFLDQDFERYLYQVSQTVMGSFKYRFANRNTIALNSLYIHDNIQEIGEYEGVNDPQEEDDSEFLRRQQTNNNNVWVNQILSEIKLTDGLDLDLAAAFNMIRGNEPDRRSNKYLFRNGVYAPAYSSAGENERYFSQMSENDIAARAVFTYKFNPDGENNRKFNFGYNFRNTSRDFEAIIYNHRISGFNETDINNPDAFFNQQNLDNGTFELQTGNGTNNNTIGVFDPFTYNGDRSIHAGLGSVTYEFNPKFTAVVGVRFEKVLQEVEYDTNIAESETDGIAKIDESYILPNFNLKYNFTENSIIRAAGSMSYTLPQFIEVAPFKYQDVSFSVQGNPLLVASKNYNFDLKWEYYRNTDEVIALTGFFKRIDNPIARSEIPSGGNTLTFLNVGGQATVAGVELEVKKNIFKIEAPDTEKVTALAFGVNVSYLNSKQDLDNPLPQFTNVGKGDQLQGASPLLVNSDLTFRKSNNKYSLTSSLVLNYFSDRIYSIGTRQFQNVIEKGIPTLDFITQTSLGKNYSIGLKAKNLLNPDFKLFREAGGSNPEEVTLSTYQRGIDISLSLTYKF